MAVDGRGGVMMFWRQLWRQVSIPESGTNCYARICLLARKLSCVGINIR